MIIRTSRAEWVQELASQGMRTKEIAKITGLSEKTVNNYRAGGNQVELSDVSTQRKMTMQERIEWTEAVNRIRKILGKQPFPMPEVQ